MIDLMWNTQGRLGRDAYRKARWRHFAFCLIPVAIYVAAGFAITQFPPAVYISAFVFGTILLLYYRYRFAQVMIRRLHDRGYSGWWLLLNPMIAYLAVGIVAAGLVWFNLNAEQLGNLGDKGSVIFLAAFVPALAMSFFLRYQLSQKGVPGANRFGPPTDISQANLF